MLDLVIDEELSDLAVGVVEAVDSRIGPSSDGLQAYCREVAHRVSETGLPGGDQRRGAVRQLLRSGGYKPAGRNKPAQEYLLRTISETGQLPTILNVVDLINAVSLDSGLPISLVSIGRGGSRLMIRYGRSGERYVFNSAGQELDVAGLMCLCSGHGDISPPIGSPVKDSMRAKVNEEDRHVAACIYAPKSEVTPNELDRWAHVLGQGLTNWCGATRYEAWLVPDNW